MNKVKLRIAQARVLISFVLLGFLFRSEDRPRGSSLVLAVGTTFKGKKMQ